MAVLLMTTIKRYIGVATDSKPTLTEADAGSTFFETDTFNIYIWNGSAWSVT